MAEKGLTLEDYIEGDVFEYMIVKALGVDNLVKAIEDKAGEIPQWRLHSIAQAGLTTVQHPLDPGKATAFMQFVVIFERPHLGVEA